MRVVVLLLGLTLLGLVAGPLSACYETPRPECAFQCGPTGTCPDGYACRADGWCKREGVPSDFDCGELEADAEPDDDFDAGANADVSTGE